jgi:2-methylisocitrate lyase-like PEP mutase family enzyme
MKSSEQARKAEALRAQHTSGYILLLPNVWDVAGARMVEEAGFPAIATSSAGIAFSAGYPDGQKISREEMLAVVTRIAGAVSVPVTADVESGYGSSPEETWRTAKAVTEAGAVGMNLEDSPGEAGHQLADLSAQLEKIRAAREAAAGLSVPIVLNARTDVYLRQVGEPATWYDETLRRLSAYRDAGADCVFAPGLSDRATIGRLVEDLHCPVNILAGPGLPPITDLRELGVARVSLGSGPMRAALGLLRRIADDLKTRGAYTRLEDAPSYAEVNSLLEKPRIS